MSHTITEILTLETETCCNCGTVFALPKDLKKRRIDFGGDFYCPNGHGQYYSKPTVDRLREEIETKSREVRQAKYDALNALNAKAAAEKAKAESDRQLARVKNGVCPCCNRSFVNLQRHIKTKHPQAAKA